MNRTNALRAGHLLAGVSLAGLASRPRASSKAPAQKIIADTGTVKLAGKPRDTA